MLAAGIILLIVTIAIVAGVPLAYFLKRDAEWRAMEVKSVETWYGERPVK